MTARVWAHPVYEIVAPRWWRLRPLAVSARYKRAASQVLGETHSVVAGQPTKSEWVFWPRPLGIVVRILNWELWQLMWLARPLLRRYPGYAPELMLDDPLSRLAGWCWDRLHEGSQVTVRLREAAA